MNESVAEIAQLVGGEVIGAADGRIMGVNGIATAGPRDLTFLESRQYLSFLETTEAAAILVTPDVKQAKRPLIQVKNPFLSFLKVMKERGYATEPPKPAPGIHPAAIIDATAKIGNNVAIDALVRIAPNAVIGDGVVLYAGVYVGENTVVGENTTVYPNVVIRESVRVGARCIIHAGAVVGADGFGFVMVDGVRVKVPQNGIVILGDDVEVGANSAIDRATFGATQIGSGTKIDNLVQIGHNVQTGEACVICGMSGIAGSAKIGSRVTIAAQAGVADHVEIGEGAVVAARAGVAGSIKAGAVVSGFPAIDHRAHLRILGSLRRLPELLKHVQELEQRIVTLEENLHGNAEHNRE